MVTRNEIVFFDKESRAFYKENFLNIRWLHKFAELDYCSKEQCREFFNSFYSELNPSKKRRRGRIYFKPDYNYDGLSEEEIAKKKAYEEEYKKVNGLKNTFAYVLYAYIHRYYWIPHAQACVIQQSILNFDLYFSKDPDVFEIISTKIFEFFALYATRNDWSEEEFREMEERNATMLGHFNKVIQNNKTNKGLPEEESFPHITNDTLIFSNGKHSYTF